MSIKRGRHRGRRDVGGAEAGAQAWGAGGGALSTSRPLPSQEAAVTVSMDT